MRLEMDFFRRDVTIVAPELIGKILIRKALPGISSYIITEVEAYNGPEDQASHARFGKTVRNAVMFENGGLIYVYLIYGMHWMLNIVTGTMDQPQAILIRGLKGIDGPGRVAKVLAIDRSFYGENLLISSRIWLEEGLTNPPQMQKPRIGIQYAGDPWKNMPWRYIMVQPPQNS